METPTMEAASEGGADISNGEVSIVSSITGFSTENERNVDDLDIGLGGGCHRVRGRSKEIYALCDSYRRLQTTKDLQLVLVHGESGCGKTALVDSMRKPVLDSKGYFCAGKYFQNACLRDPYSAIMTALSDLCDLIVQDADFDEERRLEIQAALGTDGAVLAKVVSSLNSILSLSDDERYSVGTSLKNEKTFLIFKAACKKLLTVLASNENPIVIFIDDIQWMDRGSKELLLFLIRDTEMANVMFILSYREENASELVPYINEVQTLVSSDRFLDLDLMNVDVDGVHEIVQDYLGSCCPPVDRALSELVWHKTLGNCLHVRYFLESIRHYDLLIWDGNMWSYDIERIRQETRVSDNLADSLSRSIERLPKEMQDSLKVASLLGYRFHVTMVAKVIEAACRVDKVSYDFGLSLAETETVATSSTVSSSLFQARDSRFIDEINGFYQFSHDKIQAAFQNSMDEKESTNLHRLIAEIYMTLTKEGVSAEDSAMAQCHAAIHFHEAGVPPSETGRVSLAILHLAAAKFSMEKSAFTDSAEFLRRSLNLLGEKRMWNDHFDLAFELTNTLARMQLVLGNLKECKELAGEAIAHSLTTEMKITPMLIDCEARMASTNLEETILACTSALRIMGLKLPRKVGLRHVLVKLFKVRRLVRLKSDEDILNMPLAEDHNYASSVVRFLVYLSTLLSFQSTERKNEAVYCSLLSTELSLTMGFAPFTSVAIAFFAAITMSMNDFDQADRLGKLALLIAERMMCKEATITTAGIAESLVLHCRKTIEETFSALDQAVTSALECGDSIYGVYNFACACTCKLLCGTSLHMVAKYAASKLSLFADTEKNQMFRFAFPLAQFTVNMQSSGCNFKALAQLTGDIMEEDEYRAFALEKKIYSLLWTVLFFKLQLTYHFGFYAEAVAIAKELFPMNEMSHINFSVFSWYFYAALAHVAWYRQSGNASSLRWARYYHKRLQRKSEYPNARVYLPILNAEMVSVQKSSDTASVIEAYECSMRAASEIGYCHLEALANERAYTYLSSRNLLERNSRSLLDRALHLYGNEWHAKAKCEWLTVNFDTTTSSTTRGTAIGSIVGNYITAVSPAMSVDES